MRIAVMLSMLVTAAVPGLAAAQAAASANQNLRATAVRPVQAQTQGSASEIAAAKGTLASLDRDIAALRASKDSLSEMSEADQLRLQMMMDRRAKTFEMLSNLMKKSSETSSAIIGNMK